jgi:LAO/AO transport system kinase
MRARREDPSVETRVIPESDSLAGKVLDGDTRAIARLISLVENGGAEAIPCLRALFRHAGRCLSVGITGAPGAGKSTLVDRLADQYRTQGKRVGILAVDPSSPFTGGAILGDRIRMQSRSLDPGTFIRSMATRGSLGGLSRATSDALLVLDAAGFDIVLIETVGVGQADVEIARTAQMTVVLLVPGMGDEVQALKAGIMEIGDLFVINKADRDGADRVEADIMSLIAMARRADGWRPSVLKTVATEGKGIEECVCAIDAWRRVQENSPYRQERSLQVLKEKLLGLLISEVEQFVLRDEVLQQKLEDLTRQLASRSTDPYTALEILKAEWARRSAGEGGGSRRHRAE